MLDAGEAEAEVVNGVNRGARERLYDLNGKPKTKRCIQGITDTELANGLPVVACKLRDEKSSLGAVELVVTQPVPVMFRKILLRNRGAERTNGTARPVADQLVARVREHLNDERLQFQTKARHCPGRAAGIVDLRLIAQRFEETDVSVFHQRFRTLIDVVGEVAVVRQHVHVVLDHSISGRKGYHDFQCSLETFS